MGQRFATLAHFCRVVANRERPASQVTATELKLLLQYSQNSQCVVEIGCFEGSTAAALGKNTAGNVFSIDPFSKGRIGIAYGLWIARLLLLRQGIRNVQLIRGFSFEVAQRFAYPIDFLFIDADHSYEGVKRDWQDWFPKVSVGGFVALHDCKKASNSPADLGTMSFYTRDLAMVSEIEEAAAADSLVIFRRTQ